MAGNDSTRRASDGPERGKPGTYNCKVQVWSNRVLIFLGAVGIFITGTLSYTTLRQLDIPCGGHLGCALVQDSPYSRFPAETGIPVAYIGLIGYVLMFSLAVVRSLITGVVQRRLAVAGFAMAALGLLFSLYLTYASIALVGQKCEWCLASLGVIVLMTIGHAALLQAEPSERPDSRTGWLTAGVSIVLAMGGLSYTVQDLKDKIDLPGILVDAPDDVNKVLPIEAKVRGGADAKVTLIEFADVNCPACRTAYPEMKLALAKYGNDVRFAFRHLPLIDKPGHETSLLAAAISEYAADKGLFWKFMDNVFHPSNRERIKSLDGLYAVAAESGLDRAELIALLNSTEGELSERADSYYERVDADIKLASTMLVTETPTLILYGEGLKSKVVHYTRVGSTLSDAPYRELLGSK